MTSFPGWQFTEFSEWQNWRFGHFIRLRASRKSELGTLKVVFKFDICYKLLPKLNYSMWPVRKILGIADVLIPVLVSAQGTELSRNREWGPGVYYSWRDVGTCSFLVHRQLSPNHELWDDTKEDWQFNKKLHRFPRSNQLLLSFFSSVPKDLSSTPNSFQRLILLLFNTVGLPWFAVLASVHFPSNLSVSSLWLGGHTFPPSEKSHWEPTTWLSEINDSVFRSLICSLRILPFPLVDVVLISPRWDGCSLLFLEEVHWPH